MKKFLVVLMLLVVASAYSVGGSMYMRYQVDKLRITNMGGFAETLNLGGDSAIVATESWANFLEDLRVGRRGTGFDLNFDAFTLSYKLRSPVNATALLTADIGTAAGRDIILTSPGYVQFSGLKVGPASMAVGLAWWHKDYSYTSKNEPTGGPTVEGYSKHGANIIGIDLAFDLPIGDNMRLHIDPWDKVNFVFGFGDADVKNGPTTNSGSSTGFSLVLPIHLSMNFEALGIEIFPKISLSSKEGKSTTTTTTNENKKSESTLGLMVRVNYIINELLGAFLHAGIVSYSAFGTSKVNDVVTTNGGDYKIRYDGGWDDIYGVGSYLEAPIFGGLTVKPAGPVLLTLGLGFRYVIDLKPVTDVAITNVPASGLIGEYAYFDQHGYKNPFLRFAGSAKFASDWEIGMSTILYWNQGGQACGWPDAHFVYYRGGTRTSATGKETWYESQLFHFNYFNNWDSGGAGFGANYLQFSKDNVTIRGVLGGANGLAGLFSFVDVSFAF